MTTEAAPATGTVAIRRHPTLRVLLAAETISMLGTQLSAVAMPWLALQLTGSTTDMGLVMAAQIAAIAVFGFFGASWTGRIGPRRIMIVGDTVRGPLVALLPLLYWLGWLGTPAFVAVMFAMGAFFAPYTASQQSILPTVVGEDEQLLSRANAALQSATRLSVLLGPVLGGALISLFDAPVVLLLDAVSFAASAVLLRLCLPHASGPPAAAARRSPASGLRTLLADRLVSSWSAGLALGEMAWQALFALMPVIAVTREDGSSVVAGVLLTSFGGGALLGTLLVGRLLKRLPARTLAVGGRVALGAAFAGLLLPLGTAGLAGLLVLVGFLNGASSAPVAAVRVLRIPAGRRTEALTVATAIALVGGTAGWLLAGTTVQRTGLSTTFACLAALQAAAAVLFVIGAAAGRDKKAED
ncbi:MFS transporter [Streptomyces sp. AV19]|uniref:MFS transporter n=1 Tax=Streptomyces sp. AV19 TaxID=2793068 RepID=UPI0018FEC839|nr:MFS transporter [Streptomyces sp. AV19]MBH1934820.1 MFS transporter [Streptomyces sp. AV19]MDG4530575.1 MFS transporter [Streptomyces sp. AV19]